MQLGKKLWGNEQLQERVESLEIRKFKKKDTGVQTKGT